MLIMKKKKKKKFNNKNNQFIQHICYPLNIYNLLEGHLNT